MSGSMENVKDKQGNTKLVIFGKVEEGKKVIWIEAEPAFANFEIQIPE